MRRIRFRESNRGINMDNQPTEVNPMENKKTILIVDDNDEIVELV